MPNFPNKYNEESIQHPINYLLHAIEDIEKLHEAHSVLIQKDSDNKNWCKDQPSIYARSGITLLCACWEAFIEDCVEFALEFIILNCNEPSQLPLALRKKVAKEIKLDKNDLSVWELVNDGWKTILSDRFKDVMQSRLHQMNSPKSHNVIDLYSNLLGIEDITDSWQWENYSKKQVMNKIDLFVTSRGAIAHGRDPEEEVGGYALKHYTNVVLECSYRTNNAVRSFIQETLNLEIWPKLTTNTDWSKSPDEADALPKTENILILCTDLSLQ